MVKPTRKSPPVLGRVVLLISAISIAYIGLFCFRQTNFRSIHGSTRIELMEWPCHHHKVPLAEIPYLHYPEPTTYNRNECACTPVRFFAILSMQRSGSGWFETLLNSHINISSNGEIFSVKERRSNVSNIIKTMDKVYNLDWYSSASKNECTSAVGFKWMLNQGLMAHHEEIVEYFNRRNVYTIFLFRRNLLRRLVSLLANDHDRGAKQLNGTHKAHVHSTNEAKVLAKFKPTINATLVIPTLRIADKAAADALESFKSTRHILLYYEDLIQNRTKLRDVQRFLGVPRRKLVSRHIKIHTRPLSEQVDNWDDISIALQGTQFESFLKTDYDL